MLLREKGHAIEVVNAGIRGYGNDQSVKLFTSRLRDLDPDLVVLAYHLGDLDGSLARPLYGVDDGRLFELDATRHPLYRHARIQQALPAALRELRLAQVLTKALARIGADPPDVPASAEDRQERARRKLDLQLTQLLELGVEDDFQVALLGLPYEGDAKDRYRFLRAMRKSGLVVIDTSRDPRWRTPHLKLLSAGHGSLTAKGHRELAAMLARDIERQRAHLLPDG